VRGRGWGKSKCFWGGCGWARRRRNGGPGWWTVAGPQSPATRPANRLGKVRCAAWIRRREGGSRLSARVVGGGAQAAGGDPDLFLGRVWIGQVGLAGGWRRPSCPAFGLEGAMCGGARTESGWAGAVRSLWVVPERGGGGASRSGLGGARARDRLGGEGGRGRCDRCERSLSARVVELRESDSGGARDLVIGSEERTGGGDQMLLGRQGRGLGTPAESGGPGGGRWQGRSLRRRARRPGLEGAVSPEVPGDSIRGSGRR
jgi:hypothetical protein